MRCLCPIRRVYDKSQRLVIANDDLSHWKPLIKPTKEGHWAAYNRILIEGQERILF